MTEIWAPIPGFSDYQISDLGRVWSSPRVTGNRWGTTTRRPGKFLRHFSSQDGYPQVRIVSDDGEHLTRKVHRLVLLTFIGEPSDEQEALHLDDDHTNPALDNLRWGTRAENMRGRQYVTGLRRGRNEMSRLRRERLRERLSDD